MFKYLAIFNPFKWHSFIFTKGNLNLINFKQKFGFQNPRTIQEIFDLAIRDSHYIPGSFMCNSLNAMSRLGKISIIEFDECYNSIHEYMNTSARYACLSITLMKRSNIHWQYWQTDILNGFTFFVYQNWHRRFENIKELYEEYRTV